MSHACTYTNSTHLEHARDTKLGLEALLVLLGHLPQVLLAHLVVRFEVGADLKAGREPRLAVQVVELAPFFDKDSVKSGP
jgi:hypothetical protein